MNSFAQKALVAGALALAAVTTWSAVPNLADRHVAKSVQCPACHGSEKPNGNVPYETCIKCHGGSYTKLAEKTAGGDINFHAAHVGEADCKECHHGHKPSTLLCSECHDFKAKVP